MLHEQTATDESDAAERRNHYDNGMCMRAIVHQLEFSLTRIEVMFERLDFRIMARLGAEVRVFDPIGLPMKDGVSEDDPKVQELRTLSMWSEAQVRQIMARMQPMANRCRSHVRPASTNSE